MVSVNFSRSRIASLTIESMAPAAEEDEEEDRSFALLTRCQPAALSKVFMAAQLMCMTSVWAAALALAAALAALWLIVGDFATWMELDEDDDDSNPNDDNDARGDLDIVLLCVMLVSMLDRCCFNLVIVSSSRALRDTCCCWMRPRSILVKAIPSPSM